MDKQNVQQGFNLIEVMVSVSILSILLSIGVPSYVDSQKRNNADTNILKMKSALNMAKQHAIYQARNMVLCPVNDNDNGCYNGNGNGNGNGNENPWSRGAIVFAQADDNASIPGSNGYTSVDTDKIIYRIYGVKSNIGRFTSTRPFYVFDSNGFTTSIDSITYCDASNTYGKKIAINASGKMTLSDFSCGS